MKKRTVSFHVETRRFVGAHARRPRGTGTWWFDVCGAPFSYNGPYGEALRRAKAFGRHIAGEFDSTACTIYVEP